MNVLGLYIPDCNLDCRILEVVDVSLYDGLTAITNPVIKINIPGSDCDFTPIFKIKGRNYYTSNTFDLTDADCSLDLINLPDGVYTLTYSICPNEEVFTQEKYLRDCITRCKVLSKLSSLLISCEQIFDCYGNDATSKTINELKDLLIILDTAKVDVKNNNDQLAEDKLEYVITKLNTI